MTEQTTENKYIRGEITFTIYENPSNHFTIAKINIHDTNEDYDQKEIVGKGNFFELQKGVVYNFYGTLTTHPKFGVQYDIEAYQTFVPKTEDALVNYLSSDLFPGIGEKTATNIVNALGENAIATILKNPEQLDSVAGLRNKVKKTLINVLEENQGFERVALQFSKYNIGLKMAQRIYEIYKEETLQIIKENPYEFVFEVEEFGFQTADKIALMNDLPKTNRNRMYASCYYTLQQSSLDGHVFLPVNDCVQKMQEILATDELSEDTILTAIDELAEKGTVSLDNNRLYLPSLEYAEQYISEKISNMIQPVDKQDVIDAELMTIVGDIEDEEHITYGDEQFKAIKEALQNKLVILTGGPGTGKTTVIKGIIKAYAKIHNMSINRHDYENEDDYPFILTAPTGRAAKRLQESTNIQAMTIHRLLGWDGHLSFDKNEHEKLKGKYLIIDEFSMVDTWLGYFLFRAISKDMQILIVGDEDQLPSVGPGQVLSDLLQTTHIPRIQLQEVYRQQEGSKIIELAHQIKHNSLIEDDLKKERDFSFIHCRENQVIQVVETIYERALKRGISPTDIQVLAPMYKSKVGIDYINKHIQQLVNPPANSKRERYINDTVYRIGDRVLQLVNQPEEGVYNGDVGEIIHILTAKETDEEEQIVIQFDQKEVTYTRSSYLNFTLAYCMSIHKAQGSEFPIVILPVVSAYRRMLRKNLLYTAITRSTDSLIVCGDLEAFLQGIYTTHVDRRYTSLKERLLKQFEKTSEQKKKKKSKTLSPYDFL